MYTNLHVYISNQNPVNYLYVHYIVKYCNMELNLAQSIRLKPITILKVFI